MSKPPEKTEGLRARKRRQTRQRLTEVGLKLFLDQGYEATTLDQIAAAAGVSRRTIFHYFAQKEDILLAWKAGLGDAMRVAILAQRPGRAPLDLVLAAFLQLAGQFQAEDHIRIERLLASTERLDASKHAKYAQQEQAVFEALVELSPAPERRDRLRLVAMAAVGALRVAFERWAERTGAEPLADHLRHAFAELKAEVGASRQST
ncbi:MAG TPA: TetR family transcriptional regulator [Roseiarcus sp.]|nr:TetR family transcriptional regulator [Roseiarcus sp.]